MDTTTATLAKAPEEARDTLDAVIDAVQKFASPHYVIGYHHPTGVYTLSLTWHDGAQYRVTVNDQGDLLRLYRLQYPGGWVFDPIMGRDVPDSTWRTVRAFSRDRAGKVLRGALSDVPATAAWVEASAR